jgi:UDP-2,3-diacylglucosamine hydrolase
MPYGLIAGNGRFPVLALEAARRAGIEVVAIGIKEEAGPDLDARHWISLGQLSKLIDICKSENITQIMMCGQVKHAKIFSSIVPDWRLVKLLASIDTKNTEGLIGGVAKVLRDEGIELVDSTLLLKDLLAPSNMVARSLQRWPQSMSAKASRSRIGLAWRWRRWKGPTQCCGVRLRL